MSAGDEGTWGPAYNRRELTELFGLEPDEMVLLAKCGLLKDYYIRGSPPATMLRVFGLHSRDPAQLGTLVNTAYAVQRLAPGIPEDAPDWMDRHNLVQALLNIYADPLGRLKPTR